MCEMSIGLSLYGALKRDVFVSHYDATPMTRGLQAIYISWDGSRLLQSNYSLQDISVNVVISGRIEPLNLVVPVSWPVAHTQSRCIWGYPALKFIQWKQQQAPSNGLAAGFKRLDLGHDWTPLPRARTYLELQECSNSGCATR